MKDIKDTLFPAHPPLPLGLAPPPSPFSLCFWVYDDPFLDVPVVIRDHVLHQYHTLPPVPYTHFVTIPHPFVVVSPIVRPYQIVTTSTCVWFLVCCDCLHLLYSIGWDFRLKGTLFFGHYFSCRVARLGSLHSHTLPVFLLTAPCLDEP